MLSPSESDGPVSRILPARLTRSRSSSTGIAVVMLGCSIAGSHSVPPGPFYTARSRPRSVLGKRRQLNAFHPFRPSQSNRSPQPGPCFHRNRLQSHGSCWRGRCHIGRRQVVQIECLPLASHLARPSHNKRIGSNHPVPTNRCIHPSNTTIHRYQQRTRPGIRRPMQPRSRASIPDLTVGCGRARS